MAIYIYILLHGKMKIVVVIICVYNIYKYTICFLFILLLFFLHSYEISVDRTSDTPVATPVSVLYYCTVVQYRDPYPIIFRSSYITVYIL